MRKAINYLIKINEHYIDSKGNQLGLSLNDLGKAKIFTRDEMLKFITSQTNKSIDRQYITDMEIILIEE